jgi:hypothetical protein
LFVAAVMPLTAAQVRNAITSNPWTKDFRHLEPFPLSHLKRYSFKDILVKAVKPQDRIKYWNIVPGDRVRLIGDKEGKVLEVAKVNKLSSRVYLKGLASNVRARHRSLFNSRVYFLMPVAQSRRGVKADLKTSIIHDASCSSGTLSSLRKARPRSQGHYRTTINDFFLSDSMTLATFQRLCHARWHLKTILATNGCALRVEPLCGRDDTETSQHRWHIGPYQNSVAKATRPPHI